MAQVRDDVIYQGSDVLLLRAAARSLDSACVSWPDPADSEGLRTWLVQAWEDPVLREAVGCASPSLALRADRIAAGLGVPARQVLSAAVALARYQLRAAGRPTPFGLFAGVAAARFGGSTRVRFGGAHRAAARCDAAWLLSVIERCEAYAPLAGRLTVVFSSLAVPHAGKWEVPAGPDRQVIRDSPAVRAVRDASQAPVRIGVLADGRPRRSPARGTRAPMTGSLFDPHLVPAHVEIAACVRAASMADLDAGRYILHISPARAAGTLTSRFSALAADSGLDDVYRNAPAVHDGARPVQLSVPPLFIRGQNIGRIPAYLPGMLSLGEHPGSGGKPLGPDDLAVTATLRGLHLVDRETGQVIEPQVFHALDLEKQMPTLGRFLAHLPRAFTADYLAFDWGPFRRLPRLPAVRYRRSVLSPEQWRLTAGVLPPARSGLAEWRRSLAAWRVRTGCPGAVQLHNGDLTLRLDLDEPLHALCLREHLDDDKPAIVTRAPGQEDFGWIGGHAHEIALPLTRRGGPAPTGMSRRPVPAPGAGHGQLPLAADSAWLSAKLFTARDAMDEIIGRHLPALIASLGTDDAWFIRYRNREETDHLRLRIAAGHGLAVGRAATLAVWAGDLRIQRLCARFTLDTYHPEVGRYGGGQCMRAAEAVFTADSAVAIAQLQRPPGIDPIALTALGMLDIAAAFCGGLEQGTQWLAGRRLPSGSAADRAIARAAVTLARNGEMSSFGTLPGDLASSWRQRAETVAAYRKTLGSNADTTHILDSLLHIHHNRYRGIDRNSEGACRRIARQAALARRAAKTPQST